MYTSGEYFEAYHRNKFVNILHIQAQGTLGVGLYREMSLTMGFPVLDEVLKDNSCRPSPRQSRTSTILQPETRADLSVIFFLFLLIFLY